MASGDSIFEALAALAGQKKKLRQKRKPWSKRQLAQYRATLKRNRRERLRKLNLPGLPRNPYRRIPDRACDRVAFAMVPGEWHGRNDIRRAVLGVEREVGVDRDLALKLKIMEMMRKGFIERARNPAAPPWSGGAPVVEPVWLYRLTALGEALRRFAGLLL